MTARVGHDMGMFASPSHETTTRAFDTKDGAFDGVIYGGIITTGIFCCPSCPARTAKPENREYFACAQDALLAGYRPCKRCHPLSQEPDVQEIVSAVEAQPQKRWKDRDFTALTNRHTALERRFKQDCALSFVAYARARRLGLAFKVIRTPKRHTRQPLEVGQDIFSPIMGSINAKKPFSTLTAQWIESPLGPLLGISDEIGLCLLEFTDRRGLEREIERLRKRRNATIHPGTSTVLQQACEELVAYFSGTLRDFQTPLSYVGTDFQINVWQTLRTVPHGSTITYADLAARIGKPNAPRAAGRANGANQLAIIVPCHRVIGTDGTLTGYGGGLDRKKMVNKS